MLPATKGKAPSGWAGDEAMGVGWWVIAFAIFVVEVFFIFFMLLMNKAREQRMKIREINLKLMDGWLERRASKVNGGCLGGPRQGSPRW